MRSVLSAWTSPSLVGRKNGYAGRYPRRLPVEGALGGERGLRDFIAWANERGIRVYLQDNYVDGIPITEGFRLGVTS